MNLFLIMLPLMHGIGLACSLLSLAVGRANPKRSPPRCRKPTEKERRVMTEILCCVVERKGYRRPGLTLDHLSCELGFTRVDLSHAVNRNTGLHFCRWLNEIRIGEAVVRLSDPARTNNFSEIAYDVGFNDRTTFFRAFKQITGSSPRDFCRSLEKKCCDS